jgi:hypothetical protein
MATVDQMKANQSLNDEINATLNNIALFLEYEAVLTKSSKELHEEIKSLQFKLKQRDWING